MTTPQFPLRRRMALVGCPLAVGLLLAACGGGGSDSSTEPTGFAGGNVALDFTAVAGSTAIDCSTASIAGLGTTRASARLQDLRFYVSNVRFVRADGSEQPMTLTVAASNDAWNATKGSDSVTLIDLENASGACDTGSGTAATNARVAGSVPSGDYVAMRFTLGVPHALNHLDPMDAATPLALTSMALGWNWTTGRIFSKIEVADPQRDTTPTWSAPVFTAHLGAGGCSGDPGAGTPAVCSRPNLATVTLGSATSPFDPTKQKVAIDVAALVAGNNVTANAGGASGCMSAPTDPECNAMFQALQLGLNDGLPINGGVAQTVFSAIAR